MAARDSQGAKEFGGPLFILDRECIADVHNAVALGKSEPALTTKYLSEAQPN